MREEIRDVNFKILGYVETDRNGNKTIRDASFNTKGFYSKGSNVTQDKSQNNLAWGDQSKLLLKGP